jgi:hypothetical protein
MTDKLTSKSAESSFIQEISVTSNKDRGKSVSITGGTIKLEYFESIVSDGIKAKVTFIDSGNAIEDKNAVDGLPIVGEETVRLKFTDNNNQTLDLMMYVNRVTPLVDLTTKTSTLLVLVSKEGIMNEKVRLNTRFDGKISEHITNILTDPNYLGTEKDIDIEETTNEYNFVGNNWKPFYAMNWLSKKAVPNLPQAKGNTAGYFFYETSDGFKFKSIDTLLSQEKKKSIIYNETPDSKGEKIPEGYDMKALEYTKDSGVDVQNKLQMGAFSTRTVLFDPFTCYYEVITPNAKEKEDALKLAGRELPVMNPEFERPGSNKEFSRTQYMLLDKGSLPSGSGTGKSQEQIQKSKKENFEPKDILNQATMRYNQLFTSKTTITIPGDFSLHAGDAIFVDAPSVEKDVKNDKINKESGGLYIIATLCHYITPKESYTKLELVRDSIGRTGNHSRSTSSSTSTPPPTSKPASPTPAAPDTRSNWQKRLDARRGRRS